MKDLIQQVEEYRISKGLIKAEMAKLIGANSSQQYNNWVYRNSLPKEYIPRAQRLLETQDKEIRLDAEILEKIERLPEAKAALVIQMIDGLLDTPTDD